MVSSILVKQLDALISNEHNNISILSNSSALLMQTLENINWAGFYIFNESQNELVLGPFQGKVACMHIANGNGVCGVAFKKQSTVVVDNVHEFPGHIACDSDSQSEIVIPITQNGVKYGVLDIDSPIINRFSNQDKLLLEEFVKILIQHLTIDKLNDKS